jgi:transcriptional regulator with XRE-family HTH domain
VRIGEAVRKRILELCDERGITLNKLATICGITQSTLNNIINGRNNSVTIATIKKICDGLNISVIEFFSSDAFDSMEQEIR